MESYEKYTDRYLTIVEFYYPDGKLMSWDAYTMSAKEANRFEDDLDRDETDYIIRQRLYDGNWHIAASSQGKTEAGLPTGLRVKDYSFVSESQFAASIKS